MLSTERLFGTKAADLAGTAVFIERASIGRVDYAIEETAMNLLVNLYPILHHRNTRRRILALLSRRASLRKRGD